MCNFPFFPRRTRLPRPDWPLWSRVVGVCQYPDAFAVLARAEVVSAEHFPFRIKPERGQVAKHTVESSSKESCDVLHEHVIRSQLANDSKVLAPES